MKSIIDSDDYLNQENFTLRICQKISPWVSARKKHEVRLESML